MLCGDTGRSDSDDGKSCNTAKRSALCSLLNPDATRRIFAVCFGADVSRSPERFSLPDFPLAKRAAACNSNSESYRASQPCLFGSRSQPQICLLRLQSTEK